MVCNVLALFALAASARILIYLEKEIGILALMFLFVKLLKGEPTVNISVEQRAMN